MSRLHTSASPLIRHYPAFCIFAVVLLTVIVLFSPPPTVIAADAPLSINTSVSSNNVTLGEIFTYTLTITHPENVEIETPGWGANVGQFEIRDYHLQSQKQEGQIIDSSQYQLAIYDTGKFTIPPVQIAYHTKGKKDYKTLMSDSVTVTVKSLAPEDAKDIKGLKPQLSIPPDYTMWYIIGGSVALLIVVVGLLLWYIRKRRKEPEEKTVYLGPPHEVALKEIETLLASELLEKGEIKAFYFQLSEIVRKYLGRRFQIYTLERTTDEIMEQIEALYLESAIEEQIRRFMQNTDLVKFAKYVPDKTEINADLESARDIIHRTRLKFDTEQAVSQDATEQGNNTDNTTEENNAQLPAH